jgi:hypothetical protein
MEASRRDRILSSTDCIVAYQFRDTIIPELTTKEFADMFAQTLAYELFAAVPTDQFSQNRLGMFRILVRQVCARQFSHAIRSGRASRSYRLDCGHVRRLRNSFIIT